MICPKCGYSESNHVVVKSDKEKYLVFWGYTLGTPEAEEAWRLKQEMTARDAPMVMSDIEGYVSQVDGTWIKLMLTDLWIYICHKKSVLSVRSVCQTSSVSTWLHRFRQISDGLHFDQQIGMGQLMYRYRRSRRAVLVIKKGAIDLIVAFEILHVDQKGGHVDYMRQVGAYTLQ